MKQLTCLVCGEPAECLYFGAISCRACAAFFRRKVVECRQIPKRCEGKCKITARRRNSCAHCRFESCLNVGMKMTAVMQRVGNTKSTSIQDNVFLTDPLTLLERLKEAYQKLQEARKATFNLKDDHIPQLANYIQMNAVVSTDYKIIGQTTASFFESVTNIPDDQKKFLYRHFLLKFFLLDCGFKAKDKWFTVNLANGNFMDYDNRAFFYWDPEHENCEKKNKALTLMEPYWWKMGVSLVADLSRTQVDAQEFVFLAALLYWDFGVQNQSEESTTECIKMRSRVMKELTEYEKSVRSEEDSALRIGELMFLLQALQKAADMMEESRQLLMICDLCDLHSGLLEAFFV